MPTSHLDMLTLFHSLCGSSPLIQKRIIKPLCRRGAICKSLLMKGLLPSVLTSLHWPEANQEESGLIFTTHLTSTCKKIRRDRRETKKGWK